MEWLQGKKTIIGGLLVSLLGCLWSLDQLIAPASNWLTTEQYEAVGLFVAGLTGVTMRLAIGKPK